VNGGARPDWYPTSELQAWSELVSAALDCEVRVVPGASTGEHAQRLMRLPVVVNGVELAAVEVGLVDLDDGRVALLRRATAVLEACAETRHAVADLVRTTARQWRELAILYRSSDLVGASDPGRLATELASRACRAMPGSSALVRHRLVDRDPSRNAVCGEHGTALAEVAAWGERLAGGVVASGPEELARLGWSGAAVPTPLLLAPLAVGERVFGVLALSRGRERALGAEELKLARLLAGQASLGFAHLELVERARVAERVRRELEVAADLQESILPPPSLDWGWGQSAGVCLPAARIGGDAFLLHHLGDGSVLAGVADVTGHGVPSALLMSAFATVVAALATTVPSPARLLGLANDLIAARVGRRGLFITAVLLRLDPDGGLRVAAAGHPPVLLVSASGELREVARIGLPLGVTTGARYREARSELPRGAFVVAFSDGVTESFAPDGAMYGAERLQRTVIAGAAAGADPGTLRDRVLADVADFAGSAERLDDLTLLAIRRKP